jgi:hypothetical protein
LRAEPFALLIGITYLSLGLLGLVPAALIPPPADAPPIRFPLGYGYLVGVFAVNGVLTAVHIALGAWGIAAWRRLARPMLFVRALGLIGAFLAVMGIIPATNTLFGLMPLHGDDIWLHAVTAALAAYFAWQPALAAEHRARPASDRREKVAAVAEERRHGHADRRLPAAGEEL